MGKHKALLPHGNQQITFLEKVVRTYVDMGIERIVIVVSNDLNELIRAQKIVLPENAFFVVNHFPERGRFFSLMTGLKYLNDDFPVFIQNIDNPFVNPNLLAEMVRVIDEGDVITPVYQGKSGHPVLINPLVCKAIMEDRNPESRIDHVLAKFIRIPVISEGSSILVNINSPGDYTSAFPEM
jgi:molybdenum cofactor cytidylyltransferase